MLAVVQEACINCGNGICEEYETPKNCPQDCIVNATSCEELPPLDIDALDRNSQLAFQWEADTIVPNSDLYLRESDECVGEECEWGPKTLILENYQSGSYNQYSVDMPQDNLKFYQLVSKVRIGPKEANCEPQCLFQGTRSEGFYDPCTEPEPKLFKYDFCSEKEVHCCFIGTESEGFYDAECDEATGENLISRDATCHLGAKLCEQPSNLMVKYDQEFKRPGRATALTGVNWMWFLNIHGVHDTEDLLNMGGGVFDYIAYWDAENQKQMGSARGDKQLICKPAPGGKGKLICYERYVITGKFNLDKGKPYFVSLSEGTLEWKNVFVGDVPEHVTFELKVKDIERVNYITLPLDTQIKKASQICNDAELGMQNTDVIGVWDVDNQEISNPITGKGSLACRFITRPGQDFEVYPGQVYRITIPQGTTWHQK